MQSMLSSFKSLQVSPLTGARPSLVSVSRTPLVVVAAGKGKVKKNESAIKRAEISEVRRAANRSRKSAISTRIKKVTLAVEAAKDSVKTEADMVPLEKLISEAFSEIDRAVSKGVLHDNTGARKKARLSNMKRKLAISAGLYKPAI